MARTKAALGAGARLSDYLSASLMARVVPPQVVHEVLDAHDRNSRRIRAFPAVPGVYFVMALSLYPEASYEAVFSAVSQGLAWEAGAPQPVGVTKVAMGTERSGEFENVTLEGLTVLNHFERSQLADWTAVVAVPKEIIDMIFYKWLDFFKV